MKTLRRKGAANAPESSELLGVDAPPFSAIDRCQPEFCALLKRRTIILLSKKYTTAFYYTPFSVLNLCIIIIASLLFVVTTNEAAQIMVDERNNAQSSQHRIGQNNNYHPFVYQRLHRETTVRPNPPTAWLTPASEPSNAARPVMCNVRDSHSNQCNLNIGPEQCGGANWTSAVTFTTLGSEVLGTFIDLPDQPIGAVNDPQQKAASATVAYRMPASKSTGGISVAVVRVTASCCVRRLTVVGYTSAGSADHCNLNLCGHSIGTCYNGGICTATPGICACRTQWNGAQCEKAKSPPTTTQAVIYWPGAAEANIYQELPPDDQPPSEAPTNTANSMPPTDVQGSANAVQPQLPERNANQRWCPEKFLCCDHGLAYYDPGHQMMCCNNRAVPIVNFTKACPELGGHLRGNLVMKHLTVPTPLVQPTAAMNAAATSSLNFPPQTPNKSHPVPPGVVLLAKGVSNNSSALIQRLAAAVNSAASHTEKIDPDQLAALIGGQNEMMEMICNGISHWVARNNRARYGCCGGKIYDIVWDTCAMSSAGLGVVRRVAANGKNSTLNKGENEFSVGGSVGNVAAGVTMMPPPTPMGSMLKNENDIKPPNWLHVNVFKKQQAYPPSLGPSVQRRRRLIARNRYHG